MKPIFYRAFSLVRLAVGLAAVGAVTFVFSKWLPVNASTAGFFFLIVVLGVAMTSGFRVSALVSLTAVLCFNFFFLPPVGRFTIADPENWVALFTFLLTALVASHLSDRAQKQAAEAKRRQQETEQLYALSRSILLTGASRPIGTQAAQSIAQIFDSPTVIILDGKTTLSFQGGAQDVEGLEQLLQDVIRQGSHHRDASRDLDIWPIALGGNAVGALAAAGIRVSDGAVQSMLNLVAIALEFKTPLTSIKAAATGLRALDQELRPDQQELAAVIEEEADRLSQLVTEAAKMAEIDAGKVMPHRSRVPTAGLLRAARESFEGRGAERFQLSEGAASASVVLVDSDLITLAVRQVLENALKYSDPGSPITFETAPEQGRVLIRIAGQGSGIPERDRERIFDKFYRRASVRNQVPGSGLGLHLAREIAWINGGDLWVETADGRGVVPAQEVVFFHAERKDP